MSEIFTQISKILHSTNLHSFKLERNVAVVGCDCTNISHCYRIGPQAGHDLATHHRDSTKLRLSSLQHIRARHSARQSQKQPTEPACNEFSLNTVNECMVTAHPTCARSKRNLLVSCVRDGRCEDGPADQAVIVAAVGASVSATVATPLPII